MNIILAKLSLVQGNGNTAKTEMNGASQVQLFHRGRFEPLSRQTKFFITYDSFCSVETKAP